MGGINIDDDDGQQEGQDEVNYGDEKDCDGEAKGGLVFRFGV